MKKVKISIRLPLHLVNAIDTLINIGEFDSRTEVIKWAIKKMLKDISAEIDETKETWLKFQELQAFTEEMKKFNDK